MPYECNLLQYMHLMKCPRCGFEQPEDRYCASCGADVEKLKARPTPFFIRILQNPKFHLSLIGVLIALVVFYILYSQSELVSREVRTLLDLPITSKEAGSPEDSEEDSADAQDQAQETQDNTETATPSADGSGTEPKSDSQENAAQAPAVKSLELSVFEIPRETLIGFVQVGEKLAESTAGRAFYFPQGQSVGEAIVKAARRIGAGRQTPLQAGAQFELETPPTSSEAFQFALFVQQGKWDGNEGQIRFDLNLALPQPENSNEAAVPTLRQILEVGLSGSSNLSPTGLLLIVIDPPNRSPRAEFLNKAGEGPWSVFQSDEFKAGASDWIVLIQPK